MEENLFQFSKIDHLENFMFDQSLEEFRSTVVQDGGISERTIREIIQNSMDAKNDQINEPVIVNLSISKVAKKDLPGIDELFSRIKELKPGNSYSKETVDHMKLQEYLKEVLVLTASDSNTKGLSGVDTIDGGTYAIYAYNKGVHGKVENTQLEDTRGGSHGVGKIANNAASDIHLMYFANTDEKGNKNIGGSIQLFDHHYKGANYRGTGYYAKMDHQSRFVPYINEESIDIFKKPDRGLKIIIPYLREDINNEEDIIKSVCNNFFIALLEKRLVVYLEMNNKLIIINNETLEDLIAKYYEQDVAQMKKEFLPLYYRTYTTVEPEILELTNSNNQKEPFSFKLYFFDEDENIPTGRVAIVRSMGMKIEDRKIPNNVRQPFNAVLIGGPKEDRYLKTLENQSHTALSADAIRNIDESKKAKKFLRNLDNSIKKIIEERIKEKYQTDGLVDTSDLITDFQWEFNDIVQKKKGKVQLADGKNLSIDNKIEERKGKNANGSGKPDKNEGKPRKPRRPRKTQPKKERESEIVEYLIPSDVVDRIYIGEKEMVEFNFNELEEGRKWNKINLAIKLITGDGEEIDNGIKMNEFYYNVKELLTNTDNLTISENKIENIPVTNGKLRLLLNTRKNFNAKLKYIYKVELIS
ncbi:hypothetical protein HMPREF2811_01345 [Globicatella sp. HMSC072A10]|uniref:hypothetical protein n=1 Tax=Globicatella sp. HMSC072A10 TaxID=1739315 RepID=UPI0008C1EB8E|nr:hypothetical protein [Globicatella sp. HMSC072A10]OFK56773.1 hypothetical protein HMPREF2811_01345 [Globicatella sp. HMSC072A10]